MVEGRSATIVSITTAAEELLKRGAIGVLITVIDHSSQIGSKLLVEESGSLIGTLGIDDLDRVGTQQAQAFLDSREETRMFRVGDFAPALKTLSDVVLLFELIRPEPRIVICGAGHVGTALCKLASFAGYQVTLIDDRSEFLTRDRFNDVNVDLKLATDWGSALSDAIGIGRGVSVAVVTRGHNEDEECLRAIVATNPDYIGLIGSKRRTNIVIDRLRKSGASIEKLQKVRAPIGLDIGAVTPEEVAIAILAEIVAERRGGKGGSLSAWRRSKG